jgi:guanosine-3',5'-bis(diphosphate) 3'-pyrophosphohydrolase
MKISRTLLEAISFSARAHHGQVRKDRETPYHAHPVRVATVLMGWGVDDEPPLAAARTALADLIDELRRT